MTAPIQTLQGRTNNRGRGAGGRTATPCARAKEQSGTADPARTADKVRSNP